MRKEKEGRRNEGEQRKWRKNLLIFFFWKKKRHKGVQGVSTEQDKGAKRKKRELREKGGGMGGNWHRGRRNAWWEDSSRGIS